MIRVTVDGRLPHQPAAADVPGFVTFNKFGQRLVPVAEVRELPPDEALSAYFGLIDAGWADTQKDPLRWGTE